VLNLARKLKRRLLGGAKAKRASTPDVFVGLASIPSRVESLKQVIEGMLPQVKGIGVYLNNYEEVPAFLKHPKIQIARSQDHGDVRDNGKFFFLDKTNCAKYATIDDDIAYPSNYIERLLKFQQALGGTHAVGVHAVAYGRQIEKLLKGRYLWHFKDESNCLLPCNMVGTGTLLFDQRYFKLDYSEIGTPGMADVWFAVAAKKRGFTLWVAPRKRNWLKPIEIEEAEPEELEVTEDTVKNLYTEGLRDDSVQVDALNAAGISGSTHQFLESIVRSPRAAREFSLEHVAELRKIAEKHGYKILKHREARLYDYALTVHKREGLKNMDARIVELLEGYSEYQVRALSGVLYDRDFEFEALYKQTLLDVGFENLPKFAQVDFKILGLDGGSALSHDDSGTTEDSVAEASESELAS
jgi:hypothetical protein